MFNTDKIIQASNEEECRIFGHIWSLLRTADNGTAYRECLRCNTRTTDEYETYLNAAQQPHHLDPDKRRDI